MDQRLSDDSFFIKDLKLSELRLFNHETILWLLLVPKPKGMVEWIDLSFEDQMLLQQEINLISKMLKQYFPCDKLNIASLGNVVPQLHIHIIARRYDDPYFPAPVFGCERAPYTARSKELLIQKIQGLLA